MTGAYSELFNNNLICFAYYFIIFNSEKIVNFVFYITSKVIK